MATILKHQQRSRGSIIWPDVPASPTRDALILLFKPDSVWMQNIWSGVQWVSFCFIFALYVCFKCEMCHKLSQWLCLPAHLWLIFVKENKVMYLHVKGHFWRAVIIFSVQCYLLIHNLFSARKTWPGHKYAAKQQLKFAVNWNSHLHEQNQTLICIHELMKEITASIRALYSVRDCLLIAKWCK